MSKLKQNRSMAIKRKIRVSTMRRNFCLLLIRPHEGSRKNILLYIIAKICQSFASQKWSNHKVMYCQKLYNLTVGRLKKQEKRTRSKTSSKNKRWEHGLKCCSALGSLRKDCIVILLLLCLFFSEIYAMNLGCDPDELDPYLGIGVVCPRSLGLLYLVRNHIK